MQEQFSTLKYIRVQNFLWGEQQEVTRHKGETKKLKRIKVF